MYQRLSCGLLPQGKTPGATPVLTPTQWPRSASNARKPQAREREAVLRSCRPLGLEARLGFLPSPSRRPSKNPRRDSGGLLGLCAGTRLFLAPLPTDALRRWARGALAALISWEFRSGRSWATAL